MTRKSNQTKVIVPATPDAIAFLEKFHPRGP